MYICVLRRVTTHSLRINGSRREKAGGEVITCFHQSQRCVRNKCKFNVLRDECTSEVKGTGGTDATFGAK